jgi:hypothetical protein
MPHHVFEAADEGSEALFPVRFLLPCSGECPPLPGLESAPFQIGHQLRQWLEEAECRGFAGNPAANMVRMPLRFACFWGYPHRHSQRGDRSQTRKGQRVVAPQVGADSSFKQHPDEVDCQLRVKVPRPGCDLFVGLRRGTGGPNLSRQLRLPQAQ